jgi:hypothetical protein
MGGPPLVGWLVVAVGAVTGVSCLLRTRAAAGAALGAAERRLSRAEGVKGLGMALMALPAPALAQHPYAAWLFGAAFGLMTLWTLPLPGRAGHAPAHHLHLGVGAASMVYMSVVMATAPAGHGGMAAMTGMTGPAGLPLVNGALLAYFGLYALWAGLRMLPAGAPATAGAVTGGFLAAPELAAACRVSLGIGMFAMLLTV